MTTTTNTPDILKKIVVHKQEEVITLGNQDETQRSTGKMPTLQKSHLERKLE